MRKNITIALDSFNTLEFTLDDFVYFSGGNINLRNLIISSLKNHAHFSTLTSIEKEYYKENNFQIHIDEKTISQRDIKIIHLDSLHAIINELTLKNRTLLSEEILSLKDDFDLSILLEELNDRLITLESNIGTLVHDISDYLSISMTSFTLDELLKKKLLLNFKLGDNDIPINFVDPNILLEILITLIASYTEKTGNQCWVVIDGLSNFISEINLQNFFQKLTELANSKNLVNFFIFDHLTFQSKMNIDTEKIILLYEEVLQLPPLDILRSTLGRHYPGEFSLSDNELTQSILRISPFLGKSNLQYHSISPKDMVLLIVLKSLLGDSTRSETSFQELSTLERLFLLDQL